MNLKEIGKNLSYTSRNSAQWRNNPFYKYHKSKKQNRNESIKKSLMEEDDVLNVDFKDRDLNSDIWKNDTINSEIRQDLLKIAHEFYTFTGVKTAIKDIMLVGSMANYNYTDKSDLDLHLVIDFDEIGENKDLLRDFFDTKKAYWALMHDIKIKDHDVELYVQDINDDLKSGGIFSLKNNKWIKKPIKEKVNIDKELVRKKVDYLATLIDGLEGIEDPEEKIKEADKIKDKIKKMRKSALETGGEFSEDNLAFKVLRNDGYLEKLFDIKNKAIDQEYTINENSASNKSINEKAVSEKQRKFFGIVRALQKGTLKKNKAFGKAKKAAKEMDPKDVKDFASTKNSEIKEEIKNHKFEYGCLMMYFDIPTWETKILSKINQNDLYNPDGSYGLEHNPHTTILFGFHPETTDIEKIIELVNDNTTFPVKVEIKKVSIFESKDYDVLKFDVESPDLRSLNKLMTENFEYTSNFPSYHPHMTIAYLNKGTAEKYIKDFKPGSVILDGKQFVYSNPDNTKIYWTPQDKEIKKTIEFDADNGTNKITLIKSDIDPEKLFYIQDFTGFVCDNLHMENPVHIFLRNGRDEYVQTTASYVPSENSNHINCKKRSLVDILRSIAHELTHNRQREIGKILPDVPVQNISGEIENESDSVAGVLIKHYTHTCGMDNIYDL